MEYKFRGDLLIFRNKQREFYIINPESEVFKNFKAFYNENVIVSARTKMTDSRITPGVKHTILFYEKLNGIFGKYYLLYCKRNDGDYVKVYSNRKINGLIRIWESLEEKFDIGLLSPYRHRTISFTPVSLEYYEKFNIVYREIILW